jgi:hypothetical protein
MSKRLEKAKDAIREFFSDRSQSRAEAKEGLEELAEDCNSYIEAIEADEQRDEE